MDELRSGTLVGDYRVVGKLGEGGMATVYSAVHPLIDKRAAIKVMKPILSAQSLAVMRFVQEARAVNQIRHPNIVDVFSFGRLDDGRCYLVMEWVPGETVYERLGRRRLTLDEVSSILEQLSDALEAAHEAGVIHRDVKPANVLLVPARREREQVKLLDFGVAKLCGAERASDPGCTRDDCVVGTPEYISPEQARSKAVDGRTDIYSLGVSAYEMLTGVLPFSSDNPVDTMRLHLTEPAPRVRATLSSVPAALDELVQRMMDKDPERRPGFDEIREVAWAIRKSSRHRRGPRASRGLTAGVLLALVVVGSAGLLATGGRRRASAAHSAPIAAAQVAARSAPGAPTARAAERAEEHHPTRIRSCAALPRDRDALMDPFSRSAPPAGAQ